jgi:hypothetical protein
MAKPRAYLHPSKRVLSIGHSKPRTQTHGKHPNCDFEGCSSPADFTLEIGDDTGSGYLDRCSIHLESELQDPHFSAKVLVGLIIQLPA